jgi:hypothetical protein
MRTDSLEIEHKYLVSEEFEMDTFADALRRLGATGPHCVEVRDSYFYREDLPDAVFRHRIDAELHQLTVKSRPTDSEVRREVNLDLAGPDAVLQVAAFLETGWGTCMSLLLQKSVTVWELPGFEVVHYVATRPDGYTVRCVEFEATGSDSPPDAVEALNALGRACGFDPAMRTEQSLFTLMQQPDGPSR